MPEPYFEPLRPIQQRTPAVANVRDLLALSMVQLTAQGAPRAALVQFYTRTLGLLRVGQDDPGLLVFRHNRRTVCLSPEFAQGHLALAVMQFDGLVGRLQDLRTPHEVLHIDGGLARVVLVRDPARNLVRLMETRML